MQDAYIVKSYGRLVLSDLENEIEVELEDFQSEVDRTEPVFEIEEREDNTISREYDPGLERYTNQLYELVYRGFESSSYVDNVANEIVGQMELEYFWNPMSK